MLKLYTFEKFVMSSFQLQDSQVEQSQAKPLKNLINEPYIYKHKTKQKPFSFHVLFYIVKNHCNKALMFKHYLQNV